MKLLRLVLLILPLSAMGQIATHSNFKVGFFDQTNAMPNFTPASAFAWTFASIVDRSDVMDADAGTVTAPGGSPTLNLTPDGLSLSARRDFPSFADLNGSFGLGTYQFAITGGTYGGQTGTLSNPEDFFPLSIPYFTNFNDLNSPDPSQPILFTWNEHLTNPSGNVATDFFRVTNLLTNEIVIEASLDPSEMEYTIDPDFLLSATPYRFTIYFNERSFTDGSVNLGTWDSPSTDIGFVNYDYATNITVTTAPEPTSLVLAVMGALVGVARRHRTT
jgi:hypothetical protein